MVQLTQIDRLKLKLNEYRTAASQLNGHIFICKKDVHGGYLITFSDGKIPRKYGQPTGVLDGIPLRELIGDQLYAEVKYYYKKAFQGEEIGFKSFQFKEIYCTTTLTPLKRDDTGGVIEIMGESRDITKHYCTERDYSEQTNFLNHIIELSPYSIQILDAEGYHLSGNEAFQKLFLATPPPEWSILTDQTIPELHKQIQTVLDGNVITTPPVWYNAHNIDPALPDHPVCIGSAIFPVFLNHSLEYIIIMHDDVTDRVRERETLLAERKTLNTITDKMVDSMKGIINTIQTLKKSDPDCEAFQTIEQYGDELLSSVAEIKKRD